MTGRTSWLHQDHWAHTRAVAPWEHTFLNSNSQWRLYKTLCCGPFAGLPESVYHIHLPLSGPCRLNDESCFWKQSEKWWCQTIETAFMLSTACKIWSSQRHIQSWLLMAPTSLHARPVMCSTTVHLESFSECHASSISPAAQHSEHRMHLRLSQPHCMAMVPDCLRFWALFFAKSKFLSMSYAEIMPNSCQVTSRAFCFTAIWVLMTWVLNPIPFEMNIAFFRLLINIGQQMISTMVPESLFASIC